MTQLPQEAKVVSRQCPGLFLVFLVCAQGIDFTADSKIRAKSSQNVEKCELRGLTWIKRTATINMR
jgi:hypothetical protein